MEMSGSHYHGIASDRVAGPGHEVSVPAISHLPTELLVTIIHSALQSTHTFEIVESCLRIYMRRLYTMRRVAKRWQEIIEGTPTFWTFVLATLPPHVNEMTILRSGTCSLSFVYAPTTFGTMGKQPPLQDFLATVVHTRSRWSAYNGPVVSEYLEAPAPLLQKISLRGTFKEGSDTKPLELLGGCTSDLRQVGLSRVSIPWKMEMFTHLRSLALEYLGWDGLTISHLIDFLRSSPDLEHLKLQSIHAAPSSTPLPPIITLPQLRSISLSNCKNDVTVSILHQIRAPSCNDFYLAVSIAPANADEFFHGYLHSAPQPFEEILRTINKRNRSSCIALNSSMFEWRTGGENDEEYKFLVILKYRPTSCIRWVERTLRNDHGLGIHLSRGILLRNELINELLETIAPMRCVTTLFFTGEWRREQILRFLIFLGEPRSTNPLTPSLPCLRRLRLWCLGWKAQDLLDMVESRFLSLPWEAVEAPPLAIDIWRQVWPCTSNLRIILDYAVLYSLRKAEGVDRVQFVGPKESDGMLAINWDEDASAPKWS